MSALMLLEEVKTAGINLRHTASKLKMAAARKPDDELMARIKAAKSDIIAHLQTLESAPTSSRVTASGISGPLTEGVHHLVIMSPPHSLPAERWRQFKEDTVLFDKRWTDAALIAGWSATELFGLSRAAPWGC